MLCYHKPSGFQDLYPEKWSKANTSPKVLVIFSDCDKVNCRNQYLSSKKTCGWQIGQIYQYSFKWPSRPIKNQI